MSYTVGMADSPVPGPRDDTPASLRAEQVAQTRAALVTAGRLLFGTKGFAATSVEDIARAARVTTGALYHHFPTKAAVFEAVFEQVHAEMLVASAAASAAAGGALEQMTAGFGVFLDQVLEPEVQRILVTDAPGRARPGAVRRAGRALRARARGAGDRVGQRGRPAPGGGSANAGPAAVRRDDQAGLLIASSPDPEATRDAVGVTFRQMMSGFLAAPPG